jgi:nicotinamide phosphoribosyltransferase
MLTQYPEGIVAVVSDSYNIYDACEKLWGKELKDIIANRKAPPGKLVVRPDSGDPKTIVVEVLDRLAKNFPPTTNAKGFKELPPYIRVIQGDGISYESLKEILENMTKKKWAATNVCFGSGGALLQKMDRDTQKCAFKCCEIIVDGKPRPVYKDPITDKGKKSKQGRLKLVRKSGAITTLTDGQGSEEDDLLVEVFNNGKVTKTFDFNEVRTEAEKGMVVPIFDISPPPLPRVLILELSDPPLPRPGGKGGSDAWLSHIPLRSLQSLGRRSCSNWTVLLLPPRLPRLGGNA